MLMGCLGRTGGFNAGLLDPVLGFGFVACGLVTWFFLAVCLVTGFWAFFLSVFLPNIVTTCAGQ
jgi:hypothetical protein